METQQPNFEQQVNSENTNIRTPQETQKVLE